MRKKGMLKTAAGMMMTAVILTGCTDVSVPNSPGRSEPIQAESAQSRLPQTEQIQPSSSQDEVSQDETAEPAGGESITTNGGEVIAL